MGHPVCVTSKPFNVKKSQFYRTRSLLLHYPKQSQTLHFLLNAKMIVPLFHYMTFKLTSSIYRQLLRPEKTFYRDLDLILQRGINTTN